MQMYLALPDGAGRFTQGFTGLALLRIPASPLAVRLQAFHLLWGRFPGGFDLSLLRLRRSYYPVARRPRFGLLPVRSPLLGESLLFSVPPGT